MEKQKSKPRVTSAGPGNDLFGDLGGAPQDAELATVIHGTYVEALPVAEMSVAAVRRRFGDLLDIHPEATAVLDGVPADEDSTVQAGQSLMFVRRAGEKGGWQ